MSGWPWRRDPTASNVAISSSGKYPRRAIAAYRATDEWPFERISRSRSGQSGTSGRIRRVWKYSTDSMSAAESGPPR